MAGLGRRTLPEYRRFPDKAPFPQVETSGLTHGFRTLRKKKKEWDAIPLLARLEGRFQNRPRIVGGYRSLSTDRTRAAPTRPRRLRLTSFSGRVEAHICHELGRHSFQTRCPLLEWIGFLAAHLPTIMRAAADARNRWKIAASHRIDGGVSQYFPIDVGVSFRADHSDLLKIDWSSNHLTADFILPDDDHHALRVTFDGATIVRLLDEMPLSTEDQPEKNVGLVPFHFAYRVEGATFAHTQSEAWKDVCGPVVHYEFVTGWACMDVLSPVTPTFELAALDRGAFAEREQRWEAIQREL